jgi:hypothetical protein
MLLPVIIVTGNNRRITMGVASALSNPITELKIDLSFGVFTAAIVQVVVFWVVTP